MTATRVLWVRACLNCEPLFSILDGLRVDNVRRYWFSEHVIEMNTCDMGEDLGHTMIEIEISLPMSHYTLTSSEEDIK